MLELFEPTIKPPLQPVRIESGRLQERETQCGSYEHTRSRLAVQRLRKIRARLVNYHGNIVPLSN